MRASRITQFLTIFLAATLATTAYSKALEKNFPGQLSVEILQLPTPLVALNKYYLVYELHLTNYQSTPITLLSVAIKGDDNQKFEFNGNELDKMISSIGVKNSSEEGRVLQPGMSKIVFVWLPFNSFKKVPNSLVHEVSFAMKDPIPFANPLVKTDSVMIDKTLPLVISAPLHGDNWVASNGPAEFSEHRKANIVFNGHDYFAQRYAIDFIQVGKTGTSFHDDKTKNTNYYSYGAPVFSVASGRVVQVTNGIPDNTPQEGSVKKFSRDTIAGNFLLIDIGNEKYAFYGHLMPGSIKVKNGTIVKEGQLLGKVGNSGSSTEPHLHFQVIDKPNAFAANGIPYLFHSFYVRPAKFTNDKNNEIQIQFLGKKTEKYIDQIALENTTFDFPRYRS